jgi:glucuronate isomerase
MTNFINENFLLNTEIAINLYHKYAKKMDIFDYHCHLNPKEIAENKTYENITEIWLATDHYKHRAMRINGIDEKYISGTASDKEKFFKWAETIPNCIGNPLYHWTHLELKSYFGINEILNPTTAPMIWEKCNELLKSKEFKPKKLIERFGVKVICTTDDPTDSLDSHKILSNDSSFKTKVLPTFRPDNSFNIEKEGFNEWIKKLEKVVGYEIKDFSLLTKALKERIEFFHKLGCRISDHGLDPIVYETTSPNTADIILKKSLKKEKLTSSEINKFKTQILLFLGKTYSELNWTMQLHLGAIRNTNTRMMQQLGADSGFDAIGDFVFAKNLIKFLDELDKTEELPKIILYNLNPSNNEVLASLMGCFQSGSIPGKIQFGSAWWFNDQHYGMIKQMVALSNMGLLSKFVGMITDSRSFLSFTRHEYFRRILCNLLGSWATEKQVPDDISLLGKIVEDVCYNNAKNYFGIDT